MIRIFLLVALFSSSQICSSAAEEIAHFEEDKVDPLEGTENLSGLFVESNKCGSSFASCVEASPCFDHSLGCAEDGTIIFEECAAVQPCKPCFPNSRCADDYPPEAPDNLHPSAMFIESEACGPEFATCAEAGPCFDHSLGCAEDGSVVFPQCSTALPFCRPCFPNSRCGSDTGKPNVSGLFSYGELCGPEFESCREAAPCFDHFMGCADDGSITFPDCGTAVPFCNLCFPNSRCATIAPNVEDNDLLQDENESALFVQERTNCAFELASCAHASNCFDHTLGCAEDGSVIYPECSFAVPKCKHCFPNSRCGLNEAMEDAGSGAHRFATETAAFLTIIAIYIMF